MSPTHTDGCTCRLHRQIQQRELDNRRHACYRQLANAILGPTAPRDDGDLARALAQHARVLHSANQLSYLRSLARVA
jgi:hypothetical protein